MPQAGAERRASPVCVQGGDIAVPMRLRKCRCVRMRGALRNFVVDIHAHKQETLSVQLRCLRRVTSSPSPSERGIRVPAVRRGETRKLRFAATFSPSAQARARQRSHKRRSPFVANVLANTVDFATAIEAGLHTGRVVLFSEDGWNLDCHFHSSARQLADWAGCSKFLAVAKYARTGG